MQIIWYQRFLSFMFGCGWVKPNDVNHVVEVTDMMKLEPELPSNDVFEHFFPPHFSFYELTHSNYAERHGINNIPSPAVKQNLLSLAKTLEKVRSALGHPITINSGYRNLELNRGIGGHPKSAHMQGYAADFICWGFGSPSQIVRAIKKAGIQYDQLITEGSWVHISIDPRMRGETMIAKFKNGKATYSNFS